MVYQNIPYQLWGEEMTVQERVLALRLLEQQERDPDYMKRLGVSIQIEHRPTYYQYEEGRDQYAV